MGRKGEIAPCIQCHHVQIPGRHCAYRRTEKYIRDTPSEAAGKGFRRVKGPEEKSRDGSALCVPPMSLPRKAREDGQCDLYIRFRRLESQSFPLNQEGSQYPGVTPGAAASHNSDDIHALFDKSIL